MRELIQEIKQKIFKKSQERRQHRCPTCGNKAFTRKRVHSNRRRHFGIGYSERVHYKCTVCKCEWYILNNGEEN